MNTPLAASVVQGTGKALNLKNLLVLTILTIIIMLIVNKALKQTIVITTPGTNDVVGVGEVQTKLAFLQKR